MGKEKERYLAIRKKLVEDFPFYAKHALKIIPKGIAVLKEGDKSKASANQVTRPLILNDTQIQVHNKIEEQLKRRGYVRVIVLKSRQVGISTYTEGRFVWKTANHFGKRCVIMTEADQSRDNLFSMVKTYYEQLPEVIKPQIKASNEKALIFDNSEGTGLKSRYDVKTCDSKGGLGITTQYAHLSELASYKDGAIPNVSGLLESIPSEEPGLKGTEVIIESTANGAGGLFYELWQKSKEQERQGLEPGYERIFIPWFKHRGYTLRTCLKEEELDDTEKFLLSIGVDLYQLAWRRWKIKSLVPDVGYTPEMFFKQWYPSTEEEAFVFSGKRVFPPEYIERARIQIATPIAQGDIHLSTGDFIPVKEKPTVKIWAHPVPGVRYILGADPSEGLATGDFTSVDILKYPSGTQILHANLKIDPDLLAILICHLGYLYNTALAVVESNNHGLTTLSVLKDRYYPNIYQREVIDAHVKDKLAKKAGWLTTQKSKIRIIDRLSGLLRDGESGIMNTDTLDEMSTYIQLDGGGYGAKYGTYDDRVMSYAIALEGLFSVGGVSTKTILQNNRTATIKPEPDEWT